MSFPATNLLMLLFFQPPPKSQACSAAPFKKGQSKNGFLEEEKGTRWH